ncbi:MAG: cyclic nucleotide-binding domain-containing protein [Candidatus Aminicenantes bacterium]|jgi:predicted acylesterase/phospholipase RssA/CRP-like cAMP-binding protein
MKRVVNSTLSQRLEGFESVKCYREFSQDLFRDLAAKTQLVTLKPGDYLFCQGDVPGGLYIIIEGCLQMVVESRNQRKSVVKELIPGDAVGLIALLAGGKQNSSILAVKETTLAELLPEDFEELLEKYAKMQNQMLDIFFHRLRRTHLAVVLPEYFKVMDEKTFDYMESLFEWVQVKRGQPLYRKGDLGDSLYILINGLLHMVDPGKGDHQPHRLINVVTTGQTVGEMALLSDEIRTESAYAVRDCDLVKLSRADFDSISEKYPEVMVAISRILVDRLRYISAGTLQEKNTMTMAILPIAPGTQNYPFADQLADALANYGSTSLLTVKKVDQMLNKWGISQITKDDPRDTGLRAWLAEMETSHAFVIYMAEYAATSWTKRCLSRADLVILLAPAHASPTPGKIEHELLEEKHNPITEPKKVLILVHPNDTLLPTATNKWLAERDIQEHYHVKLDNKQDFLRLARILSHRAVGLALGGGAAKGIAHIGVIRALREAGIPIDIVAGSSMGAIIGALYAMGNDYHTMLEMCQKLFVDINPFTDYTLPIISMMRGRKLERMGKLAYGDCDIEDLWINFICVSSNLTTSRLKLHRQGLLRDAVRASSAIPGVLAPVFHQGEVYVDGGVINSLPGDIIGQQSSRVIVVEVIPNLGLSVKTDQVPSPWKILWSKLLPFKKSIKVPNILEIMFSTVMTGSSMAAKSVKSSATLCLSPPLEEIGFLDFKKMDKAAEIGYNYTKQRLEQIDDKNLLTTLQGR